jgi:DNA-binding FrmR family transcriptional regulator
MSHIANDRRVLSRIRRIKGQMEGLERAVLEGEDCYRVLQQTAAARGAEREVEEVMTVIRSYLG